MEPTAISSVTGVLVALGLGTAFILFKLFHAPLGLALVAGLIGWAVIGVVATVWMDSHRKDKARKRA